MRELDRLSKDIENLQSKYSRYLREKRKEEEKRAGCTFYRER